MSMWSAWYQMNVYQKRNFKLRHPSEPYHWRAGAPRKGLDGIRDDLLGLLYQWRLYPLSQRVALIDQEYDIQVTRQTLATWYKKNGVTHAQPNYKLSYRYTPEEMLALQ